VRERHPPFNPDEVTREFADVIKSYGAASVRGDRYGGEWPRERFRHYGVDYLLADRVKSDLYVPLLPLLNSSRVELLDLPRLTAQLNGLERRTGRGKEVIDHAPGAHDDLINAVAGALVLAVARKAKPELKIVSPVYVSAGRRYLPGGGAYSGSGGNW
jgi:hypothetical protein